MKMYKQVSLPLLANTGFCLLPVNGKWSALHGCSICYAVGEAAAGG